jgi:site-specific DNA-adenine methylase
LVIEPFAGSAGYSVFHEPERALLIDAYEPVVGIWNYLIKVKVSEMLALPDLEPGQTVDDLNVPQEVRWLIGFWIHRGTTIPGKRVTSFANLAREGEWQNQGQVSWNARARKRIAAQLEKIRKWEARLGSYDVSPDVEGLWFVDPPYQHVKRKYRIKFSEYDALAAWCRTRPGEVIACDQEGADWLDFQPLGDFCATWGKQKKTKRTKEVVWTHDSK